MVDDFMALSRVLTRVEDLDVPSEAAIYLDPPRE